MKENFSRLSHNIIFGLVIISTLAVTLFFLPTTSEFFEFNKFTAILFLSLVALIVWATRMVFEKRTVFTRTPLDIPVIILVIVFLVASFSSIDQFISLFGKHGRIWPSFLPLLTVVAIFFIAVSNLKTRKQVNSILWVLIGSTALASLIAISSYFGGFLPFDFAQIRSFNPLGIINRLALLQSIVIPVATALAIYERDSFAKTVATLVTLTIFFSFILINFTPAYIGLVAGLIFLSVGTLRVKLTKSQQGSVALLSVIVVLFLVIRFVPQVASGTLYPWIAAKDQGLTEQQQIDTPKEKTLSNQTSWDIASQSIGKKPILGTGPGTYQFVYTQLKPRTVNSTDDWAIRFEKPTSEFSEIVATTGIVGTLAFLLLTIAVIRYIWTLVFKSQNNLIYLPAASAAIAFLVSNFFVSSSFATTAIFFIILALLTTLSKINNENQVFEVTVELATLRNRFAWFPLGDNQELIKTEEGAKGAKSQVLPWVFAIVVVIISFLTLRYQIDAYRADYSYRQSLLSSRSNDGNRTVAMLQNAIQINPRIDTYHRALSQTSLNAALNLSRQPDLNDNQRQLLSQLAQVAIDQGKAASGYQILPLRLPGISAANVINWETISSVYQALIGSIGGADVHATNTLSQAVSLDPQNPILHNRLGQLYQRLGNLDLAQRKFEDATIIKPDFGPARYNLALILIEKDGDVARIVNELTIAKRVLPAEDPARSDIDTKLNTYNRRLREIQESAAQAPPTQTEQSTDEEEDSTGDEETSPSPSPSPTASPSPSPSF